MNLFDQLYDILERAVLDQLTVSLPPTKGVAKDWQDATLLHWFGVSVDALQDGKLYAGYSFGKAKTPKKLYQENLSRPAFDYYGNARFAVNEKDQDLYFAIRAAIKTGAMTLGQDVDEDADDEDADWDDEIDTGPPTLIALALVAERLRTTPSLIPMPCAATFSITISNDYETATWPATVQHLCDGSFDEWTDDQIETFFGDSKYATLGRHLQTMCANGQSKETPLANVISEFVGQR